MRSGLLAIGLITLLVFAFLTPNVQAQGLLSDIFNKIKEWFASSPLGGLFSPPPKETTSIVLDFYPDRLTLKPDSAVNVTQNETVIMNFLGELEINMKENNVVLREKNSQLLIRQKIGLIDIQGLEMGNFELNNMKLSIKTGKWNETSENGSIKIYDFSGRGLIKPGFVELLGNITRVVRD